MTYATGTITSSSPAKDLMAALGTSIVSGGMTLVETYATPTNASWSSVAYGNSLFVAVAASTSTVATSPDGITWSIRVLPVVATWTSVTYGNGLFVLVGNGTAFATSTDGITWTQRTAPVSANWSSVTYGNNLYVAVSISASTIAASSPDGITWTQRTLPVATNWSSVTYGNNVFVAVTATSSTVAASSADGITWTQRTLPVTASLTSVTYGNSLFVGVSSGSTVAVSSPDGITWTQRTLPFSATWASVTYSGSLFVAVSSSSTVAATSVNGTTWTQQTLPASVAWTSVTYGNSVFVTVASGSTTAATSPDGVTWTARTLTGVSTSPTADVYKSPAASNQFGQDWYLILRRASDLNTVLFFQVAETYSVATHKASNIGGTSQNVIPVATSYANPAAAIAPDSGSAFGAAANQTLTTTAFTYWVSANANRVVVGIKTSNEIGFYAGLYDDLLPTGVTQFPLVCARMPTAQASAGAIGGNAPQASGGFTREPGQTATSGSNFEAAIHNGYALVSASGTLLPVNFTPLPSTSSLYSGNAGALSRCMIGTTRPVSNFPDAVRGLLIGVFCSGITSIAGDTITAGGKTYVRFTGPITTYGFFVDQAL
jgi:hypothetical protein